MMAMLEDFSRSIALDLPEEKLHQAFVLLTRSVGAIENVGEDGRDEGLVSLLDRADKFSVDVAWTGKHPLLPGRSYKLLALGGEARALVGKLKYKTGSDKGQRLAANSLTAGEVGRIELELDKVISYPGDGKRGVFSLVALLDELEDTFLGLGCIRFALRRASNIRWQPFRVNAKMRAQALGQHPFVLWLTGLSGSGKSTLANALEERLLQMGKHPYVLDGDNVRHGLCMDLGFTEADRVENMRRVTEVARLMVDAGLIVIVSFISPFRHERLRARQFFSEGTFLEVFVDTPLEVCEARDEKGLYAKARAGLIRNFTGIDSPYEPPQDPDIHLDGARMSVQQMVETVLRELEQRGLLEDLCSSGTASISSS